MNKNINNNYGIQVNYGVQIFEGGIGIGDEDMIKYTISCMQKEYVRLKNDLIKPVFFMLFIPLVELFVICIKITNNNMLIQYISMKILCTIIMFCGCFLIYRFCSKQCYENGDTKCERLKWLPYRIKAEEQRLIDIMHVQEKDHDGYPRK